MEFCERTANVHGPYDIIGYLQDKKMPANSGNQSLKFGGNVTPLTDPPVEKECIS